MHISGADLKTLKVLEEYDMAKRMQQYINDGSFEKSEEMLNVSEETKISETQLSETKSLESSEEVKTGIEPKEEDSNNILTYVMIAGFIVVVAYVLLRIRAKYDKKNK